MSSAPLFIAKCGHSGATEDVSVDENLEPVTQNKTNDVASSTCDYMSYSLHARAPPVPLPFLRTSCGASMPPVIFAAIVTSFGRRPVAGAYAEIFNGEGELTLRLYIVISIVICNI